MKAIIIRETGGLDQLLYEDVEVPKPQRTEVLVRIKASGVNHLDHDVREGVSGFPVNLPLIPGIEGCGEVVELGADVTEIKVGSRVSINILDTCSACANCLMGHDHICLRPDTLGVTMWGTYAEYVCCNVRQLIPMPDELSFEDAAAGHLCLSTAWHMAVTLGDVKAGMDVLVNAAGSGVGTSAIQIAKLHGARVIASAGSDDKLEMARRLGADASINYANQDLAEEVMQLTDGKGADLVVECVGGLILQKSISGSKRGGMVVTCGAHSGEKVNINVVELFRKHLRFQGSVLATRSEICHVFGLIASGKLNPVIHKVVPLARARQAAEAIKSRTSFGKWVLVP